MSDVWLMPKNENGICGWCKDPEHEPNQCKRCNCGQSDITQLNGMPIEIDNGKGNGRRSRRMHYDPYKEWS